MSQQDEPKLDELKKLLRRLERVEAEKAERAARHEKSAARSTSPSSENPEPASYEHVSPPTNGSAPPVQSPEPVTEPINVGEAGEVSSAAAKLASIKLRAGAVTDDSGTSQPGYGEQGPLNLPSLPDDPSARALAETEKVPTKGSSIGVVLVAAITAAVVSTVAAVAITAWIIRGGGDGLETSPPVLSADATKSGTREPPAADPPPETKVGGSLSETVDVAAANPATATTEAVAEREPTEAVSEASSDVSTSTNADSASPDPASSESATDTQGSADSADAAGETEQSDVATSEPAATDEAADTSQTAEPTSETAESEPVDTGAVLVSDVERPVAADLSGITETAAEPDKSELVTANDIAGEPTETENASPEAEQPATVTSEDQQDDASATVVADSTPPDQSATTDTTSVETSAEDQPVVTFETTTTPAPDAQEGEQTTASDAGVDTAEGADTSTTPAVQAGTASPDEQPSEVSTASDPAEAAADETRIAALDQSEGSTPTVDTEAQPAAGSDETPAGDAQSTSGEPSQPAEETVPSSQSQAPAPQPPYTLVNPQSLAVTPGKPFEFPLSIEARAGTLQGHTLIISGLKRGASFSKGVELMFDTWQIPAQALSSLQLQISEGFARELPITIELRRPDGLPVARSNLTLNLPGNAEKFGIPRELLETETEKLSNAVTDQVLRAEVALDNGNLRGARIALEEAADQSSAYAALLLAMSFDPRHAEAFGTTAVKADTDVARQWYDRAQALGADVAAEFSAGL